MSDFLPAEEFLSTNSSFVDGIQIAWDSTSLGAAKRCLRYYDFSIRQGLRRKSEALPLTFGILFHKGREIYDKLRAAGADHDNAQREMVKAILRQTWDRTAGAPILPKASDGVGDNNRNRETLIRALIWHTENFIDDPCQTLILEDGRPAVELSFRFDVSDFLLCGHLDKVVTFGETQWVQDYKTTTTTLSSQFFDKFSPDNQMSLYALAARVVFRTHAQGVMVDGIQSAVGFTRFARGFATRTDEFLSEWLADTRRHVETVKLASLSSHFPANDSACSIYGGCTFREICSKSPSVRKQFLTTHFEQRSWDPLVPR